MLVIDEEEKEEHLKRFIDLTNEVNSNRYNYEDEDTNSHFKKFIDLTNEINPPTYNENINSTLPSQNNKVIENENTNLNNATQLAEEAETDEDKKKVEFINKNNAFSDGYQFGDITKSWLGTTMDIAQNVTTGAASIIENLVDIGANVVASIQDITGNHETAKGTREWASINYSEKFGNVVANASPIGILYNAMNGTLDWNLEKNEFEKGSLLGETSDQVVQLVGYAAGLMAGRTRFRFCRKYSCINSRAYFKCTNTCNCRWNGRRFRRSKCKR